MTLDQIKTFLWVARLGGIRRAALQMNITQPAVSNRIAALEDSLGTVLFDRMNRGVTLTKQGALLHNHAEKIALTLEQIRAEVVPQKTDTSLLRLGVAETIALSWLPIFISSLRSNYPKITIEITVDISLILREQLLDRVLDLVLLMGPISEYSVDNIDLPHYEIGWFKSYGSKMPDLTQTPVISYSRTTRPYRELRVEMHNRYGAAVQMFPSNSLSAGFEIVAAGIAVGVFPKTLVHRLIEDQRIETFDPGWVPAPLQFTASYIGDPRDELARRAAQIAHKAAIEYNLNTL